MAVRQPERAFAVGHNGSTGDSSVLDGKRPGDRVPLGRRFFNPTYSNSGRNHRLPRACVGFRRPGR